MKEVQSVSRHFSASLEGASRRLGTFEAVDEELKYVRGEVPPNRRSMLLNKVIGRRYDFAVEERVTTSGTGDEKRQWILESVRSLNEEDVSTQTKTLEIPKRLSSTDVLNRIDSIALWP